MRGFHNNCRMVRSWRNRPACRIQTDSDPKWLLPWNGPKWPAHPSLLKTTRALSGRPPLPSNEVHWTPCWLGSYFSSSSLMLLFYTNSLLTFAIDKLPWSLKRVPSSAPLLSSLKSVWVASWRHYSIFSPSTSSMFCSFLPGSSWTDTACTGAHFCAANSLGATDCVSGFPPLEQLSTLFYRALATCWRRTSEKSAHCMLSSFVSLGFTKFWVGQVALRSPINRHALDLAVLLDDQGH